MESLSSLYGWTPEQIRGMNVNDVYTYIEINNIKARIAKVKNTKHGKQRT